MVSFSCWASKVVREGSLPLVGCLFRLFSLSLFLLYFPSFPPSLLPSPCHESREGKGEKEKDEGEEEEEEEEQRHGDEDRARRGMQTDPATPSVHGFPEDPERVRGASCRGPLRREDPPRC